MLSTLLRSFFFNLYAAFNQKYLSRILVTISLLFFLNYDNIEEDIDLQNLSLQDSAE